MQVEEAASDGRFFLASKQQTANSRQQKVVGKILEVFRHE
jgi:hypothetical protein